ncbi:DUF1801 domain-containing protein [Pseudozobellia thermophila]|uniref:YdhG-like domain-containing protein n=1 Tax=Pseudozobellia thermophila TaxID=192903 RepID=A0A1M6HDN1_9FLAO|nr:DUF1801 domain-containing protein [Pseudozobellia thermophila]SHJ20292.1 hypothetical protein SAMN04488513_10312 [Pseudozobellia thermophila]
MNPAEAYIVNQPEPYKSILLHLQLTVQRVIPDVEMKYKWRIPCFYAGKSPICYLNASHKNGYVDIAFWNSAHLTRHLEKMNTEKRKVVRSLRYRSLEEIDDRVLREVLAEAYELRAKGFYRKK